MTDIDWDGLDRLKYADEEREGIARLLQSQPLDAAARAAVLAEARDIVRRARSLDRRKGVVESFLEEFSLSTQEGLALMCLAEALLRTPDADTVDRLIAEKIAVGDWAGHLGNSGSWLVNASTMGLMLTGKLVDVTPHAPAEASGFLKKLVSRVSEPVVRAAVAQAMRIMGEQFVLGRTVEAALRRGRSMVRSGDASHFSVDMLGEGARTDADARRYLKAYADCIDDIAAAGVSGEPEDCNGVSVKLSALHARYDVRQQARVEAELYPRVLDLARKARAVGIGFCLDAEEADRLVISLQLLERLCLEPSLAGWTGLGLAVQAYQKRAQEVIARLEQLARTTGRRLMVRLVKGAYWDGEIKRAQVQGRPDFPVWTTKAATDVSYLSCASALIAASPHLFAQFATHNAHTVAAVRRMAVGAGVRVEFQRLHGMGEQLYASVNPRVPVRVYAPVGAHEDLLPYLVRRLLENGANTSFVNTFLDEAVPVERVAADPVALLEAAPRRHARIPVPSKLYGPSRPNSSGLDLSVHSDRVRIADALEALDRAGPIAATPLVSGERGGGTGLLTPVVSPADTARQLGTVLEASAADTASALSAAAQGWPAWDRLGGPYRAMVLRRAADMLDHDGPRFIALLAREAGRTLQDGIDEVREAVDFLRYYACEAERLFSSPEALPGPAGETNRLMLAASGVFVCISPWNFPLAITLGQVAAALAAGNAVLAKPAEQTPLVAFEAVRLLHAAGVPVEVLHLLPGDGIRVGAPLTSAAEVDGVAFTGSTQTARAINRALAGRDGPIATLIAETGGLNAMFVDTTALVEQVVDDALLSAFGSAGQRCSALRILMAPDETADLLLEKLAGGLAELVLGEPADVATDIGPLIDADARTLMEAHLSRLLASGARLVARHSGQSRSDAGWFFAPAIVELPSLDLLETEPFGPVLHVVRYDAGRPEAMAAALAAKGYGLTLGIHTRIDGFAEHVRRLVPAGNVYINRSMTGAVVGVQPFGGRGLSGTGPKAGGPHYLARFATEQTVSENIAARGGDPTLFAI
jgi:RHH-type transcriptional regulator, proline utilization regulon repressor / proline dehydrogenase / delta 1-pyrroline-5-carboxylate dehydrogenase